jgi:uncharacterized membrane protein
MTIASFDANGAKMGSIMATMQRTRPGFLAVAAALVAILLLAPVANAQDNQDPSVRAIMFFSPTCGHCEYVINTVLPPLYLENGGSAEFYYDESLESTGVPFYLLDNGTLQILLVDVSVEAGRSLFLAANDHYSIDSNGVPRLIINDKIYIGSADIPDALPGVISDGLAGDGIDWPSLAGVEEAVASIPVPATTTIPAEDSGEVSTTTAGETPLPIQTGDSVADRFGRDPVGNTLSVIVLIGMLASLVGVVVSWRRPKSGRRPGLAIPILAVVGTAVAAYLGYVETAGVEAVCGPVGDCNTVQQSEYARLFGRIPIGVLGLVGYLVLVAAWLVARTDDNPLSDPARIALFAGTLGGVALSAYLTFLEPFVIGATCAWCLTSAIVITVLMWLAVGPATDSWFKLRTRS